MTEAKTRPISLRVSSAVLDSLEKAGIAPADVAREALEKAAVRADQLAALQRVRARKDKFELGFDAAESIRKDRDSDHGRDARR
ncbi:MAG: hypothetical protein WDA16_07605 [Candidatus Thermoplasmatota archaeon]